MKAVSDVKMDDVINFAKKMSLLREPVGVFLFMVLILGGVKVTQSAIKLMADAGPKNVQIIRHFFDQTINCLAPGVSKLTAISTPPFPEAFSRRLISSLHLQLHKPSPSK